MNQESMTALAGGMTKEVRALWEEFNNDTAFKDIVKTRAVHTLMLSNARFLFEDFANGLREITLADVENLRKALLQLLRMQDCMETLLADVPSRYSIVKERIRQDYDASKEMTYMRKVNKWVAIVNEIPAKED